MQHREVCNNKACVRVGGAMLLDLCVASPAEILILESSFLLLQYSRFAKLIQSRALLSSTLSQGLKAVCDKILAKMDYI